MHTRKEEGRLPRKESAPNSHLSSQAHSSAETRKLRDLGRSSESENTAKAGLIPHFHLALLRIVAAVGILFGATIGAYYLSHLGSPYTTSAALAVIVAAAALVIWMLPVGRRS